MPILPIGERRVWFDEAGAAFTAPANARTASGRTDGQAHYLFAPHDPWMLHPLTLCGIRAVDIPAPRDVDCWECLQARDDA